jgi:hypothetical protein
VDVYHKTYNVDEKSEINTDNLNAYGLNRRFLEEWVIKNMNKYTIIRLPALFGNGLKKNFLYDLLNPIPSMLSKQKYTELKKYVLIRESYTEQANGFYKLDFAKTETINKTDLLNEFLNAGFTALNFTDSRARFQFYNLQNLWEHILLATNNSINCINLVTEPVLASEIYLAHKKEKFINEIATTPPCYNIKTIYDSLFSQTNGYVMNKDTELKHILAFLEK